MHQDQCPRECADRSDLTFVLKKTHAGHLEVYFSYTDLQQSDIVTLDMLNSCYIEFESFLFLSLSMYMQSIFFPKKIGKSKISQFFPCLNITTLWEQMQMPYMSSEYILWDKKTLFKNSPNWKISNMPTC